jgi:hypothetical protein
VCVLGFAPKRGDLYVGILDKPWWMMPPICKTKTKKEAAMEIEFHFKFRLKPKTKKITVVYDEQ